jgi:hypothetical protein
MQNSPTIREENSLHICAPTSFISACEQILFLSWEGKVIVDTTLLGAALSAFPAHVLAHRGIPGRRKPGTVFMITGLLGSN